MSATVRAPPPPVPPRTLRAVPDYADDPTTELERKAREGRNPRTNEKITIPASKNVRFKAGKDLRDAINAPKKAKGRK